MSKRFPWKKWTLSSLTITLLHKKIFMNNTHVVKKNTLTQMILMRKLNVEMDQERKLNMAMDQERKLNVVSRSPHACKELR